MFKCISLLALVTRLNKFIYFRSLFVKTGSCMWYLIVKQMLDMNNIYCAQMVVCGTAFAHILLLQKTFTDLTSLRV